MGADLLLTVEIQGGVTTLSFSYDKPVISYFSLSKGGTASGGEELRLYGSNFGSYRTTARIFIDGVECGNAVWLADDQVPV
jgi:hypothetical protein